MHVEYVFLDLSQSSLAVVEVDGWSDDDLEVAATRAKIDGATDMMSTYTQMILKTLKT